jgi:hypothetical protein
VEGQRLEEFRDRLPARVTILCLFWGLCLELEAWLWAGLHFGKVLYVDSSGPIRRITEARFISKHRRGFASPMISYYVRRSSYPNNKINE